MQFMKLSKKNLYYFLLLVFAILLLPGCDLVEAIFEAGVVTGILIVLAVLALLIFLVVRIIKWLS